MLGKLKKCKTCPYKLGTVTCIENPCRESLASKRKEHPFASQGTKRVN